MRARAVCVAVASMLPAAGMALAADLTLTRTARSGVPSRIAYERSWDRSCRPEATQVTITGQPAHGAVSVVSGESVIPLDTPRAGSTGRCAGQPITGDQIMYLSEPGFRGTDHVSWSVTYGSGPSARTDVTIIVR